MNGDIRFLGKYGSGLRVVISEARGTSHEPRNAIDAMLRAKAILAPMSGVTDIPFRSICRKFGCKFAFTEMADVNGLTHKNRKSFKLLDRVEGDAPLGVQLIGEDVGKIVQVAKICEDKGFELVDLNAACPARKVVKGGKGAALLKDPLKLAKIVNGLVKSIKIPVTVKIRSGWEEEMPNYLEIAKAISFEGAKAICVHPRTKEQMYKGKPLHNITAEIKQNVDIPVFASGNIFSVTDISEVMSKTGCDGVYVARGVFGRPWIFDEINEYFQGRGIVSRMPDFEELKEIIIGHYALCLEYHGEFLAHKRMYKHVSWYLKRYKNLDAIMRGYLTVKTFDEFKAFIMRLSVGEKNRLKA